MWPGLRRAAGTLLDANAYGTIAAFAGPLAFVSIPHLRWRHTRSAQAAALAINWAGAWMSGSRTAFVCGALGTVLLVYELLRASRRTEENARETSSLLAGIAVIVLLLITVAGAIGPFRRVASVASADAAVTDLWSRGGYGTVADADDPRLSRDRRRHRQLQLDGGGLLAADRERAPPIRQRAELVAAPGRRARHRRIAAAPALVVPHRVAGADAAHAAGEQDRNRNAARSPDRPGHRLAARRPDTEPDRAPDLFLPRRALRAARRTREPRSSATAESRSRPLPGSPASSSPSSTPAASLRSRADR